MYSSLVLIQGSEYAKSLAESALPHAPSRPPYLPFRSRSDSRVPTHLNHERETR